MPDPNKIKEVITALESALKVAKESLAEYGETEEPVMRGQMAEEKEDNYVSRGSL